MEKGDEVLGASTKSPLGAVPRSGIFALSFIGALQGLVQQLRTYPLANQDVGPTLEIASIMCVVVALMSGFAPWMIQRRD